MSVTQYIGARYVPLFSEPLDWDINSAYEPLTIVYHQGNSYTSKQSVPTGIDIGNTDYWAITGNYNAQIEAYRRASQLVADSLPSDEFSSENTVKDYIDNADSALSTSIERSFGTTQGAIQNESSARQKADNEIKSIFGASNNPVTYGADPTGVNDSSNAINECIENNKGKTIVFTAGNYRIDKPIKTPFKKEDRVSIDFNGSNIVYSGDAQYKAALMIGYSDNPTSSETENVDFDSSNMQSWYKNFKLTTNANCEYSVVIQNHYLNARFENFFIITQTNGVSVCEVNAPRHPSDALFSHGYLYCLDANTPRTGFSINGTDNRFTQIRIYGFSTYFDINYDGNWFDYIHTLGLSDNAISRNGISFNVLGTNWFNNIYNDTVKKFINVKNANARIYVDTITDYSYAEITGRTLVDCSGINAAPSLISIAHGNIYIGTKKYTGIKINASNVDAAAINKIDVNDVTISDNKYTDEFLAADDLIRIGLKHTILYSTGAYTGFKPLGCLVFSDVWKLSTLALNIAGKIVMLNVSASDTGAITFNEGKIIDSTTNYKLGFKEVTDATKFGNARAYIIGIDSGVTTSINEIAMQSCAFLPIYGGNISSNYGFGTFTPDYTVTV